MRELLANILKHRREFISLLVGVPSYEKYVQHMKERYPGEPILSEKAFFADVQKAKFDAKEGKISRCC
ncbi:YbdD/YjiX family protein [Ectobacillus panaciterrae]|uniref:YbdD/YjiX family protein n=1 Tax=Ectobacillus panaciterrae TaxID=363872 RepID=UPI00041C1EE3|nr:YbdD/YjiX family protein [Ectobacillus panaciterrae]